MKILFCKISCMKYYRGACVTDKPYNGGKFVKENGYGLEEYNFNPVETDDSIVCLGFVETKSTSKIKSNQLHIEKINGCEFMKNEDYIDDVLVIWCATTDLNETSVVGWYKNSKVFRYYQQYDFDLKNVKNYNVIAKKTDCVLLPQSERHRHIWDAPSARKRTYGFGQSLVWYASEENAKDYISKLVKSIEEYSGENWVDKEI